MAAEKYDWNFVDDNAFVKNLANINNFTDVDLTMYNELKLPDSPTDEDVAIKLYHSQINYTDVNRDQFNMDQITYNQQGNQSILLTFFKDGNYNPIRLYEKGADKNGPPSRVLIDIPELRERVLRNLAYFSGKRYAPLSLGKGEMKIMKRQ